MRTAVLKNFFMASILLTATMAIAQKPPARRPPPPPLESMAILKQKAADGNIPAQISLANILVANQYPAEALGWYRKAAAKKNSEAIYHIGHLLLFGLDVGSKSQNVRPDPVAGIRWTYTAATNSYLPAYKDMSKALEKGLGVKANFIEAYAWMRVYAERDPTVGRQELSRLALQMKLPDIKEAQAMARRFKNREWPALVINETPRPPFSLKLNGINIGQNISLAIINGKTLAEGETANFSVKMGGKETSLNITCVKIDENSVEIEVQGEDEPRMLNLK